MPVWFELVVVMLAAYGAGIAIGWALWGRGPEKEREE